MKIAELLEQTIGTTGSTTGQTSTVQPVSNTPSDKSAAATSNKPNANNKSAQQLDMLLKQNQINVKSTDDFVSAFAALQQKKPLDSLNPEQQKAIAAYTQATIAKPGLPTQMGALLKTMQQNQPTIGQSTSKPV